MLGDFYILHFLKLFSCFNIVILFCTLKLGKFVFGGVQMSILSIQIDGEKLPESIIG